MDSTQKIDRNIIGNMPSNLPLSLMSYSKSYRHSNDAIAFNLIMTAHSQRSPFDICVVLYDSSETRDCLNSGDMERDVCLQAICLKPFFMLSMPPSVYTLPFSCAAVYVESAYLVFHYKPVNFAFSQH